MEAFRVVATSRAIRIPSLSGVAAQSHDSLINPSVSDLCAADGVGGQRQRLSRLSRKSRKLVAGIPNFVFSDKARLDYYSSGNSRKIGASCEKKEKEKVNAPKEMKKKRLKMLKGLSTDLATFSEMGFGLDPGADQIKAKMISEAAKLLQEHLQQLFAEEKDLKQRRKEEKRRAPVQDTLECEISSSSSSESSDSDCGEVVDMIPLHSKSCTQQISPALEPVVEHKKVQLHSKFPGEGTATDSLAPITEVESVFQSTGTQEEDSSMGRVAESVSLEQESFSEIYKNCRDDVNAEIPNGRRTPVALAGVSTKKIEVCIGSKCKKSGAAVLLEEFQRVVGPDCAVSGCKCMGKCRDGPNVRISNSFDYLQVGIVHDNNKTASNPLCIGVGLEDVGLIVSNFLGESREEFGLAAAASQECTL